MMPQFYGLLLIFLGLIHTASCSSSNETEEVSSSHHQSKDSLINDSIPTKTIDTSLSKKETPPRLEDFSTFTRTKIEQNLNKKISQNIPLVVHVFVPLCDNEHQGIVPTTASLGNGFSLRSNLYWATSTGMKRYFKEKKTWTLLQSTKNIYHDSTVLERVVFKRTYPNKAVVYLVADAYRGDKMLATLNDFFRAMSNNYTSTIALPDHTISIHGGADLVVFNGHNGLLDFPEGTPTTFYNTTNSQKDMVAIACFANEYFETEARQAQAYPIVRAKSTLHPGAFIISAIIDDWAMLKPVEQMRLSAGKAYCDVHDCSIKTSKNLFYKGWRSEN